MPNIVRNVLAVIGGIVAGALVNGTLIRISSALIPPPAGVDVSDMESLKAGMHLFQPKHFIMPFLAHALGTLVGALAAFLIAASHKARFAYAIGVLSLLGGIAACFMIPAPVWFMALDLLVAYLPMAWLGSQIAMRMSGATPSEA